MRVAYDLDGVLIPLLKRHKPFYKYSGIERKIYEKIRLWQYRNDLKLRTPIEKEFYIISARQEKYRIITEEWLDKNNIKAKEVILMNNSLTFKNILEHKSKHLIEKKIDKYYDDDLKMIKVLRKQMPNIEFIHIERTSINVKTDKDIMGENLKIT